MKNSVMGISYGHHESSIFVYNPDDGKKLFIAEEWVSRVKGDSRFPKFSIDFIKENYKDLFASISTVVHFQKPLRNYLGSGLNKSSFNKDHIKLKFRQFHSTDIFVENKIKKYFGKKIEVLFSDHHYSHILNNVAFLPKIHCGLKRIHLILDGYGDGKSGGVYLESIEGDKYKIDKVREFLLSESLGILYSAITEWSGFTPNEDEYKVMALASFGDGRYFEDARRICYFDKSAKKIKIDKAYFNYGTYNQSSFTEKFTEKFRYPDISELEPEKLWNSNLCNVIASFQNALEECVIDVIDSCVEQLTSAGSKFNIICGGGVLHNSVLVGKLISRFGADLFVPPCPGDLGSSIGAANFGLICKGFPLLNSLHPYLGPHAEDLEEFDHLFEKLVIKNSDVPSFVFDLLKKNETIAVYSGGLEIGPRALGARSLICDGDSRTAVEILNKKRKKREAFRPVAPICSKNYLDKILSPEISRSKVFNWMGAVVRINELNGGSSCIHHDGSIRVQTLPDDLDPSCASEVEFYHKILSYGINFLGNTSFNIAGDPMVFRAEDVYVNLSRLELGYVYNYGNLYKVKDLYDQNLI